MFVKNEPTTNLTLFNQSSINVDKPQPVFDNLSYAFSVADARKREMTTKDNLKSIFKKYFEEYTNPHFNGTKMSQKVLRKRSNMNSNIFKNTYPNINKSAIRGKFQK
jgi:Skp family chaperone for outer membrane proteins